MLQFQIMVERNVTQASIEARKTLGKESKPVLTEEFASRVNALIGKMPDETHMATLFAPWSPYIMYLYKEEKDSAAAPDQEWVDFMSSLSLHEEIQFRRLTNTAYSRFNIRTLGQMRNFTTQHVKYPWKIGARGRAFAALAFQKIPDVKDTQEAENLILGL